MSATVQQDQASIADLERRLQGMLELLQKTTTDLTESETAASAKAEIVKAHATAAAQTLEAVATTLNAAAATQREAEETFNGQIDALAQKCADHEYAFDAQQAMVAAAHVAMSAIVDDREELTRTQLHEFADFALGRDQAVEDRVFRLRQQWELMEHQEIEPLLALCDQELAKTVEAFVHLRERAVAWMQHVDQVVEPRVRERLTEMKAVAGERLNSELTEAFEAAQVALQDSLSQFTSNTTDRAEHLRAEAAAIVSSLIAHTRETTESEIREAFENLVREALERLSAEVVEQIVTMEAGAATTGALAPILPKLIAAKHLLGAINDALDALDNLNPFG